MPIDIGIELNPQGVTSGSRTVQRSLADIDSAAESTQRTYTNAAGRMVDANGRFVRSTQDVTTATGLTLGSVGQLAKSFLKYTAVVSGVVAGTALFTISQAQANQETENFARLAGIATDEVRSLTVASGLYGLSVQQISGGLKDTQERVGEFVTAGTGGLQDFGDTLGLTKKEIQDLAKELQALSGVDVLLELVDTMEETGASSQQMSFALEGLGSELTNILPLLTNSGEELKRIDTRVKDVTKSLGAADVQNLADLAEDTAIMGASFDSLSRTLAASFAPAVSEAVNALADLFLWLNKGIESQDELNEKALANNKKLIASLDLQIASTQDLVKSINEQDDAQTSVYAVVGKQKALEDAQKSLTVLTDKRNESLVEQLRLKSELEKPEKVPPTGSGGSGVTPISPEAATAIEANDKTLQRLSDSLEVSKLQTQGLDLAAQQLAATQGLGQFATASQIEQAKELTAALSEQEQIRSAAQRAEQITNEVATLEFAVSDPNEQIRAEEEARLVLLEEFRLIDIENEQKYQDLKTAVQKDATDQREALDRAVMQNQLSSTAAGFDALADLSSAFVTDQDDENSTAFALSKAFATASAGLNLALALSQALADPSALTLPQKIGNYAAVATSGAALISTISSANYADGGYVTGAGTSRSDDIPANLSNGEFVINAADTKRMRGSLESINKGGSGGTSSGGGSGVNIQVVNNVSGAEVSANTLDDGTVQLMIDQSIQNQVPDLIGQSVTNQYSPYSKARKATYQDTRR